jgi:hypothetical protein
MYGAFRRTKSGVALHFPPQSKTRPELRRTADGPRPQRVNGKVGSGFPGVSLAGEALRAGTARGPSPRHLAARDAELVEEF